ncbi:MAG: tRNA(Ile)(2)-agmatinylcytidine synthase [Sulfolobales archaeon]
MDPVGVDKDLSVLHLGVDDLDTFGWGCTTFYIYRLLKELSRTPLGSRVKLIDYPLLARLNPSIPFKTRGNGALSLHIAGEERDLAEIIEIALALLDSRSMPGREPGVVSIIGKIDKMLARKIYIHLLTDVADITYAVRVIEKLGGKIHIGGRGVIGALGSIAYHLYEGDCTYELLAYSEDIENVHIDRDSVVEMDRLTSPLTFNNIDRETGKILIKPSTGAPVALGIRGESPSILVKAYGILGARGLEGYMILRTNQATDQHLIPRSISDAKYYRTGLFKGVVVDNPKIMRGGDVLLRISDGTEITVAIYKEIGEANKVARELVKGDIIAVGGSVKPWLLEWSETPVINAEELRILKLAEKHIEIPPKCPACGGSMESMGSGKGYRCRRCGYRDRSVSKVKVRVERNIKIGVYKPPPRNMKHLSKPLSRIGFEKICRAASPSGGISSVIL